jgi:probable F420-dependent oxidoreductase
LESPTVRIDGAIPAQLDRVPDAVRAVERRGYDGAWCGELNHDPFLPLVLAAEHTSRVEIASCIAVAFARNPMTVAYKGWDLQNYSKGRFVLGLGSQIRPHIEKRFSMPWSKPVSRMREFVNAIRSIWSCWQDGTGLRFEGEFYTHKIMTPSFVPDIHHYGAPKIFIAAVGEAMTELCGEIADGVYTHGFTTERYLREVTTPALERGLARTGRSRVDVAISCPVFLVTGSDDEEMEQAYRTTRAQLAFYGSTPAYRGVLELHGWGDLQTELRTLSLRGEWEAMGNLIDDEMLHTLALVAPIEDIALRAHERYDGLVDRILLGLPESIDDETAAEVIQHVQSSA